MHHQSKLLCLPLAAEEPVDKENDKREEQLSTKYNKVLSAK